MFNKHPKGLVAAALANMGERFGFYIMMAVLTLFISAKFGLSETVTGYKRSREYTQLRLIQEIGTRRRTAVKGKIRYKQSDRETDSSQHGYSK